MHSKNCHVYFSLSFLFGIYSCSNGNLSNSSSQKQSSNSSTQYASKQSASHLPKEADSGKFNLTHFLQENNYSIQYESKGFLNQDQFKDKVLVLQENSQEGNYLPRLTIILLGQKQGFKLYKRSETVMPAEYTTEDYKIFDTEDVSIEKGKIAFDLYALGPNGHIYFDYIWKEDQLILNELTAYFMGAGSHSEYSYLAKNETEGTLTETEVNTMEESMPSSTHTSAIKLKSPTSFENFNYSKLLEDIMQQTGNN
ncbi:hypothetical protein [Solitalea lacus]|uniref:hypothetical protein n=1 Tax=Solitalea lacus TaxID=2911172 RepID=UPI001ED9F429|nr:hypothetical protein [Solitalea lacus]UKJ08600.1 hypothetical protein L2B55_05395 [Solitalea lacus]